MQKLHLECGTCSFLASTGSKLRSEASAGAVPSLISWTVRMLSGQGAWFCRQLPVVTGLVGVPVSPRPPARPQGKPFTSNDKSCTLHLLCPSGCWFAKVHQARRWLRQVQLPVTLLRCPAGNTAHTPVTAAGGQNLILYSIASMPLLRNIELGTRATGRPFGLPMKSLSANLWPPFASYSMTEIASLTLGYLRL